MVGETKHWTQKFAPHRSENPPNYRATESPDWCLVDTHSAHSAAKSGKVQLFCQMTLGTFPSMPPTGNLCWDCLYLNAGHFKSGTQKRHFFTAFWHREDQTIIYCSQTNWDRWDLMPAFNCACLGLKRATLTLVQIWPPTWSNMHAKFSHREISNFHFSKSRTKKV